MMPCVRRPVQARPPVSRGKKAGVAAAYRVYASPNSAIASRRVPRKWRVQAARSSSSDAEETPGSSACGPSHPGRPGSTMSKAPRPAAWHGWVPRNIDRRHRSPLECGQGPTGYHREIGPPGLDFGLPAPALRPAELRPECRLSAESRSLRDVLPLRQVQLLCSSEASRISSLPPLSCLRPPDLLPPDSCNSYASLRAAAFLS